MKARAIRAPLLFTLLFVGAHAGFLLWWHLHDALPPAWDPSVHLHLALDYREALLQGQPVTSHWASFYPPGYHWSLVPAFLAFPPSEAVAAGVHLGYLALLTWALSVLGQRWYGTAWVGRLAALVLMACVHLLWVSRRALIDFPLTALVTVGWATLTASEGFTRWRPSLLFGLVSAWGCLTKPTYAFFVFPAAMWLAFQSWRQAVRDRPLIQKNALLAFGLVVVLAAPWYVHHLAKFVRAQLRVQTGVGVEEDPPIWSVPAWTHYGRALPLQMGEWLAVVAGCAVVASLVLRKREDRWPLLWIISGYVGLTLLRNKDHRYTLPYLPALALLISAWTWRLKGARLWIALVSVAAVGHTIYAGVIRDPPRPEDWKHRELLQTMAAWHDPREPQLLCAVLNNHPLLFGRTLRWTARTLGIPMQTAGIRDDVGDFAEFVLFKSGDLGPASGHSATTAQQLLGAGRSFTEVYRLLATYPLPDGSTCQLFQRSPTVFHLPDLSLSALERRVAALLPATFHLQVSGEQRDRSLSVKAEATTEELRQGRLRRLIIEGRSLVIKKIPIASLRLELEDVLLNLYRLWDEGEISLLSVRAIHPTIQVNWADLTERVRQKVTDLESLKAYGTGQEWTIEGRYKGVPVEVHGSGRLVSQGQQMVWRVNRVRLAGCPLPTFLLGDYRQQRVLLTPTSSFPITLKIHAIEITKDHLLIS